VALKTLHYKLCFYVPVPQVETVKNALFAKGAGKIGNYDCVAWQTLGQGQFRPLAGSNPHLGEQGKIETVEEYKVEMVCAADIIKVVIKTLIHAHPYEEPAYDVFPLTRIDEP